MGGEETRLIGAAIELSRSDTADEEAAEGGQVAAPGVGKALELALFAIQGTDIGKLAPP